MMRPIFSYQPFFDWRQWGAGVEVYFPGWGGVAVTFAVGPLHLTFDLNWIG